MISNETGLCFSETINFIHLRIKLHRWIRPLSLKIRSYKGLPLLKLLIMMLNALGKQGCFLR